MLHLSSFCRQSERPLRRHWKLGPPQEPAAPFVTRCSLLGESGSHPPRGGACDRGMRLLLLRALKGEPRGGAREGIAGGGRDLAPPAESAPTGARVPEKTGRTGWVLSLEPPSGVKPLRGGGEHTMPACPLHPVRQGGKQTRLEQRPGLGTRCQKVSA